MAELRDKRGRPVVLRPFESRDAEDVVDMEIALVADGRGQVRIPSDLPERDAYVELTLQRDQGREWWVAVVDGRVLASGSVSVPRPSLVKHLGMFEIGVHPDAQGLGLGELLTRRLIEVAREVGVLRLELGVRADNTPAVRLYQKLGFETEVIRKGYVRLLDGTLVDDRVMVLWT